jgi:hypothetical protein
MKIIPFTKLLVLGFACALSITPAAAQAPTGTMTPVANTGTMTKPVNDQTRHQPGQFSGIYHHRRHRALPQ